MTASASVHRPASIPAWNSLRICHIQSNAWRKNPETAPEPNWKLLLDCVSGPIRSLSLIEVDGELWVLLEVQNLSVPPIALRPCVALMLCTALVFGGSLYRNPNGKGLGYLSLYRADDTVPVARLVAGARAGEVVKQRDPLNPGYDHESLFIVPVDFVRYDEGKPTRSPAKGRRHMVAVAVGQYHRRNSTSGIITSARQYQTMLTDCFKFIDARYAARSKARVEDDGVLRAAA